MVLRRLVVVVFAVLAPLASVLAIPAAAQEEWPQYSRDDAAGCDVTTSEDGAEERSCDDGSYGARWADGSGYWYDAASGCQIDIDPAGAIVYDSCAEGGGDEGGGDSATPATEQVYDEATGCWINEYGDGSSDQNCDDGSSRWNSSDGSGVGYDAGSGCSSEWDSSGAVFNEWCDDGGGDGDEGGGGGESDQIYDEATGCWINEYGDGSSDQNCDDGSWRWNSSDGSGVEYDAGSGCSSEWDSSGAVFNEWCDDGGGEQSGEYDEATGCWVYEDGSEWCDGDG